MNIVCLGAGVMSSALAVCLSKKHEVSIVTTPFDKSVVDKILKDRHDIRLDVSWPDIAFDSHPSSIDLIVVGVNSQGITWALEMLKKMLHEQSPPVLLLTKGIVKEGQTLLTVAEYFEKQLPVPVMAISGPCIAKLLAHGKPTNVMISHAQHALAKRYAGLLSNDYYQVSASSDAVGCGWTSGLKNIYAICIGRAGDNLNMRSSLFSQSLQEMAKWCEKYGGEIETAYGLSGAGDLYVTCQGGRNGKFGSYLSQGLSVDEVLAGPMQGMTIEGLDLARELSSLPIDEDFPLFNQLIRDIQSAT